MDFPITEKGAQENWVWNYRKPSIIEILDAIREDRRKSALRTYLEQEDSPIMGKVPLSLPNWLADFWIWEKENGYITPKK